MRASIASPTIRACAVRALWFMATFLAGEFVGMGIAWGVGR